MLSTVTAKSIGRRVSPLLREPSARWLWPVCFFGFQLYSGIPARADITLSTLFTDGMVLQRGMDIPIWGKADAGESITVSLAGRVSKAVADGSGFWRVKLPQIKEPGPFNMVITGKNTVTVANVAIGEVWIASGQSNMSFLLSVSPVDSDYGRKAKEYVEGANDPLLRLFTVPRALGRSPLDNLTGPKGSWQAATPKSSRYFSAVAYHFAVELRKKLKVPVGIIHASWGGTPAEAWTSRAALESDPFLKPMVTISDDRVALYPAKKKKYDEELLPRWEKEVEKAKAEGKPKPKQPPKPSLRDQPGYLFNAMISPLIPYGIKGVVWYQGEANAARAMQYQRLFPALIKDWRARWNEGMFPFLFVQLANYQAVQTQPSEGGWAPLREAQLKSLSVPCTGMASAVDLADPENPMNPHPHNKFEVGRRLSLVALATVYHQPIDSYSGPLYSGFQVTGSEIKISFNHVDGGLMAKGDALRGFAIAGNDSVFVWADAKIEGESVIVSSNQVREPKAVRYGWASNPIGNLYNTAGLPASPFRTDTDPVQ